MKLCHSWWQLSWWFLWRGCACVYVCGGQFGFMHEGFCWFWLVLGPLRASVRAWHSHRKEGSRRAKSCWGRDLAGGLVEKQGFRVRARGVRGGGCKNKIPPPPSTQIAWHPGTIGNECKGFALASCHCALGTRGSLSSAPPPPLCSFRPYHDGRFSLMTLRAGMEMWVPRVLWGSGRSNCGP